MFIKMDFEKWDKTATVKVHLRFCKTFLGLNIKASIHAALAEMGRFPLQIVILHYAIYLHLKDSKFNCKTDILNVSKASIQLSKFLYITSIY